MVPTAETRNPAWFHIWVLPIVLAKILWPESEKANVAERGAKKELLIPESKRNAIQEDHSSQQEPVAGNNFCDDAGKPLENDRSRPGIVGSSPVDGQVL